MKPHYLGSIIVLSVSLLSQARSQSTSLKDSGFAFYLLRDSTIATYRIIDVPIDSLALDSVPLFTGQDIKSYFWSTHTFVLKPKADSAFRKICSLGRRSGDIPFVVSVGNERIYLGEFSSPLSSFSPHCTFIGLGSPSPYRLYYPGLASLPDKRSDKRIHDALQTAGVLVE